MDTCPCCVYDKDRKLIGSNSLEKLAADDLSKYAFKAMTTWGDTRDFKHFLPRLFELQAFRGYELGDPEVLFGKLTYGEWKFWPEPEQKAITDYFDRLWQYILVVGKPAAFYTEADSCLCGISQAIDDLSSYLVAWQTNDAYNAVSHFIVFVRENIDVLVARRKLGNAFWDGREAQMAQVIKWLLDPATHEIYIGHKCIQINSELAVELSVVLNQLQCMDIQKTAS